LLAAACALALAAVRSSRDAPPRIAADARASPSTRPAPTFQSDYSILADELANEFLDFDTARHLLIALAKRDARLETKVEFLKPGPIARLDGSSQVYLVGPRSDGWTLDLEKRIWRIGFEPLYEGEFCKDRQGHWVARLTYFGPSRMLRPDGPPAR
jgi:hypothetical protein